MEEEDEDDANEVPDLEDEEEGEKENEDLCNEGGTPVSKPMRQHKRKSRQAAVTQEPNNKKKKTGEKSNKQGTEVFSSIMKIFRIVKEPGGCCKSQYVDPWELQLCFA